MSNFLDLDVAGNELRAHDSLMDSSLNEPAPGSISNDREFVTIDRVFNTSSAVPLGSESGFELSHRSFPDLSTVAAPAARHSFYSAQDLAATISGESASLLQYGINEGFGAGDLGIYSGRDCGCGGTCGPCSQGSLTNRSSGTPVFGRGTGIDLDQVVFLDFDTGEDGNIAYTDEIQAAVMNEMAAIYAAFGVDFVLEQPETGDFSTLFFNTGGQGGLAEDIDFRNQNKNDNAIINSSGIGFSVEEIIFASANIGAHELGHILGLRHHDAFGTIGAGIPSNLFFPGFSPIFTGPMEADETRSHIMNTPALAGTFVDVQNTSFLGEREAIKLAFAVQGLTIFETDNNNDTSGNAQPLELRELAVPNTLLAGENAGSGPFLIEALSVVGSFDGGDVADFYSFEGKAGVAYSFEVISNSTNRFSDFNPINSVLSIFDSEMNFVDYYGSPATNMRDVEFQQDAIIFDLFLPADGTYFIEVDTSSNSDTGNYELFINGFDTDPFVLPDEDDHSGELSSEATALVFEPLGQNFIAREDGIIGFPGDLNERDVFTFSLDSNASRVIIDARATAGIFNSVVELFDASGNLISANDDSGNPALGNPLDAQIMINGLGAGDYFVAVSGSNSSTGSYRVSVRHNGTVGVLDDHGDTFGDATNLILAPLPSTTFVNAAVEIGSDKDFFEFVATATGRMVVRSRALSGDLNTVLRGYDSDQNLLDSNNNFNGTLDSRVILDIVAGESYFVSLNSVQTTTGDYRLSFRTVPDPGLPSPGGFGGPSAFSYPPQLTLPGDNRSTAPDVALTLGSENGMNSQAAATDLDQLAQMDGYNNDNLGSGILTGGV